MKSIFVLIAALLMSCSSEMGTSQKPALKNGDTVTIDKQVLIDKIKGGWAGQVIGCTYGGPTEFRYNGTMIGDEIPIPWDDQRMLWYYQNSPGLYDDVYMDLTFVDVFEKHGLDAADSLHALAFAKAEYPLWHANQAARHNILNGIMPPASGHWKNNPHADDIDFQIESDFAGLMSPGMPVSAVKICDRIGRIMNYGDGLYGGMFVASMYSLAFVYDDINFIVSEALKSVPDSSEFRQCIADIIRWHQQYPGDWKQTWFEAQKKWTFDKGCPAGVFNAFNIDAKINAAYIVIGLLYGEGDFGKTIDISTRCGYDSDCNPANAAGILGALIGYSQIPDYWKQGLDKVENLNMKYTDMSLDKVYEIGAKHALQMIERNGGSSEGDKVAIKYQEPVAAPFEVCFEGLYPAERINLNSRISAQNNSFAFQMKGSGFVISGQAQKDASKPDRILEAELYIDNQWIETLKMPTLNLIRKLEVAWKYDLPEGEHVIKIEAKDIPEGYAIQVNQALLYSGIEPEPRVYF